MPASSTSRSCTSTERGGRGVLTGTELSGGTASLSVKNSPAQLPELVVVQEPV